ncbi:MAG TPA: hypothetical protein DD490_08465, partial [Acidobacteria bacterium]|nr:hypothetical protein [Acidobacteriota bacterium]
VRPARGTENPARISFNRARRSAPGSVLQPVRWPRDTKFLLPPPAPPPTPPAPPRPPAPPAVPPRPPPPPPPFPPPRPPTPPPPPSRDVDGLMVEVLVVVLVVVPVDVAQGKLARELPQMIRGGVLKNAS